jgi:hypothetical protein
MMMIMTEVIIMKNDDDKEPMGAEWFIEIGSQYLFEHCQIPRFTYRKKSMSKYILFFLIFDLSFL